MSKGRELSAAGSAPREADGPALLDAREREARGRAIASAAFPELAACTSLLDRLGIPFDAAVGLAGRAEANRWPLAAEIVASGLTSEAAVYRAFAEELGVAFQATVEPRRLLADAEESVSRLAGRDRAILARQAERDGRSSILLAPTGSTPGEIADCLARLPGLRERVRLVPPSALRAALWARARTRLAAFAERELSERQPQMSARSVLNGWQGVVVGIALVLVPLAFLLAPAEALFATHLAASLFFLACVTLRMAAIRAAPEYRLAPAGGDGHAELPVYSVLVALFREREVVPDLLRAIERIEWPRGRLDVKLVCEEDDGDTVEAIRAERPPPFVEVVLVPPGLPRTKPKALSYALPAARGEFVALFDAEDRPDPLQLREAWERFRIGGPTLACVQAPIVVANGRASLVSRMFSLEYAALFRALLPYLALRRSFLPLGGTSNHFRREALERVGGWDPFNVTEDADLGLRLARFGYRTGTITRPTFEDAPEEWRVWLPQRTRWFKGWVQTWLVHMRDPLRLALDLGPRSFGVAQVLLAGMIASALVHPVLVATLVALLVDLAAGGTLAGGRPALLFVDVVNVLCGYGSFLVLAWRGAGPEERRGFAVVALATPLYWLMLSLAAWNALWQLWRRPHHWGKTPHKRARALAEEDERRAAGKGRVAAPP